ncbi:glycosyltransferase [Petrocella sp. FN5]|uniref:glycosyltransferase n=1 Tax=Petrocella sp. FN5 TaxID=3032002 RepID=UPI0023D9D7B5|nr:glycosyltransferase [Petrocella sp. FN5]MDF1616147.1 glycosyltransferase [Petrocella sp. FN5]
MRVLHLLNSDRLSGAENVAVEIINGFDGEIEMAYSSSMGAIEKSLNERNVKYIPLRNFSKSEIKSVVMGYQPDIIHAHDIRSSIQAVRVAKKIPVISHIHGNHDDMKKASLKSILYMLASFKFKHIIGVSKSVVNDFKFSRLIRDKCSVLYNVISKDRVIKGVKNDSIEYDFDFVYLGRLSEPKNPSRIARIASKVLVKVKYAKFGIIGEGNMVEEMKEIFIKNQVIDRVEFLGFMANPYKVLSQSNVMIMCSRYEGTPMAALEALSLGIPIVSTSTDGLVELIDDDINGYISDDDDDFANKVSSIIIQKKLFERLSAGAKEKSIDYTDMKKYKEKVLDIYSKCLGGKDGSDKL